MRVQYSQTHKRPVSDYFEYETYDSEPSTKPRYDIPPELQEELLDHSYFLKHRVWRQMKKMNKHNPEHLHFQPAAHHKSSKFSAAHHFHAA